MALRGCLLFSKQCAFFFNFLIWLSGVFLLCIAIYIRMDSTFNNMVLVAYPDFTTHFHFVCYFLISLATIITLVGFFGCCSSFQESHSMLSMFIGCLVLFLLAQLATFCWLFLHRNTLKHTASDNIKRYIDKKYGENIFINEPLDHLQITFKCCGSDGPSDYLDSVFLNNTLQQQQQNQHHQQYQQQPSNENNLKQKKRQHKKQQQNKQKIHQHSQQQQSQHHQQQSQQQPQQQQSQQQQSQQQHFHNLPTSCCGYYDIRSKSTIKCISYDNTIHNINNNNNMEDEINQNKVNDNNNKENMTPNSLIAYDKGCSDEMVASLKWLFEGVVAIVVVAFVAVQFFSLTLSICLCCGLKRHSAGGYK